MAKQARPDPAARGPAPARAPDAPGAPVSAATSSAAAAARAPDAPAPDDPRRRRLLDAALATFMQFGFRKTSMEEVARAGQLSRQALYQHFSTKEELFRAAVRHAMASGLEAAAAQLRGECASVEARLSGAFDAWVGRYAGVAGSDVADLPEAVELLAGPVVAQHEEQFVELVAKAIRASGLPAAYKAAGITSRQLADTLNATARGLKHSCPSRDAFVERFGVAVRALCLPLRDRQRP